MILYLTTAFVQSYFAASFVAVVQTYASTFLLTNSIHMNYAFSLTLIFYSAIAYNFVRNLIVLVMSKNYFEMIQICFVWCA